jgi:hypothetical protein
VKVTVAIFGSILINRQVKGLLACDNVESSKAQEFITKLISAGTDSVEKLLEAIPTANETQKKVLQHICNEILKTTSVDVFIKKMEDEETDIGNAAKEILFKSQSINVSSLLKQLSDPKAPITQIIDVLEFQKEQLKPEQLITQALKITGKESARLFKMANELVEKVDIESYELQPSKVTSPDKKLHILDFFALIKHPKSAKLAAQFLDDNNHMIKIAALNTLRQIKENG